jgi:hypothetical protein
MALILNLPFHGGSPDRRNKEQLASDKPGLTRVFGFSSVSSNQSNQVALSTEPLAFFDSRTTKLYDPAFGLKSRSDR